MGSGGWGGWVHNPDPLRAQVCQVVSLFPRPLLSATRLPILCRMSARDRYILRTTERAYFVLYLRTLVVFLLCQIREKKNKTWFLSKGGENLLLGTETWKKKLFITIWYLAKIRRNRCNELLRFSLINKLQLCLVSKILLNYIISHGLQKNLFIFSNILSSKLFI